MSSTLGWIRTLVMTSILLASGVALGADGLGEINQARALAGGVTPGDAPDFPVQIFTSGSFLLTSDLNVPVTSSGGIEIHAPRVVIDLNGFSIVGAGTCGPCPVASCSGGAGSGKGIYTASPSVYSGVEIRNGAIRGMGADGVLVQGGVYAENLLVRDNGARGIDVLGGGSIKNVEFHANGSNAMRSLDSMKVSQSKATCNLLGIEVGFASSVSETTVEYNGGTGIFANARSSVTDNTVLGNQGAGISVAEGSSVSGNTVYSNAGQGIYAVDGSYVQGNVVTDNAGSGIALPGPAGAVHWNMLSGNGYSVTFGKALDLGALVGFSNNVLTNNGANAACYAVVGGTEMLQNTCDGLVSCVMAYCPFFDKVCGTCIP